MNHIAHSYFTLKCDKSTKTFIFCAEMVILYRHSCFALELWWIELSFILSFLFSAGIIMNPIIIHVCRNIINWIVIRVFCTEMMNWVIICVFAMKCWWIEFSFISFAEVVMNQIVIHVFSLKLWQSNCHCYFALELWRVESKSRYSCIAAKVWIMINQIVTFLSRNLMNQIIIRVLRRNVYKSK